MVTSAKDNSQTKKPQRNFLLLQFSILSLIAFLIIGYVVVSAVRPAIEQFVITEREASNVVFVNRYANEVLQSDDFSSVITSEQQNRLEQFVNNLPIKGSLRIFVTDSSGNVIYTKPSGFMGASFMDNPDVQFAFERRRATARFQTLSAEEEKDLGVRDVFVQVIPVTFGISPEVAGVVYSISRVGLLKGQIEEAEQVMTIRIIGGLLFLYALLFVIVWRASRTIRTQSGELETYARTLERRVQERTQKLEETTKQQLKQANELAALKDEFVFVAAHELRAPITRLRWSVSNFFSESDVKKTLPPAALDLMQVIKRASDDLNQLVTSLLDVARLESGTIKISVHPTDLISVIQDVILESQPQAEKKKIELSFAYDSSKKFPYALSDSERLKEVFSNLLSNGLKFNTRNGSVKVTVVQSGDFLEARVADTGIGMTKEELSKLFTKFWRRYSEIEGTGLGLWITKQLVERMGGEIAVESEKGKGTTFTVRLPIAKDRGVQGVKKQST